MRPLILAFQFLTIIPLKVSGGVSERDLSRSTVFFPVVGAFQGLLAAVVARLSLTLLSGDAASALAITALVLCNGGFHLDGLADTFDALAVKSRGDERIDRDRRLAVMKDSTTGAIGVVSIVLAILLKFVFMRELLTRASVDAASSFLFLMPVFSKWVMVPSLYIGTSARQDGLGKAFMDSVTVSTVAYSSLFLLLFCAMASSLHLYKIFGAGTLALFFSLCATFAVFSFMTVRFCTKRFGGLTGDIFGAINEISEILFLFVVVLWLQRSI
ncbi:MAG TPA: adenosylcobinamide-GDP ribazoletransferase [Thermodesulfovibrionales bacterium]|nr:adenosylcobinamide-GDP ribazoletransferase [Thermodesulfovibrionales bacterium]